MATIDELMYDRELGSVKITHKTWDKCCWFYPSIKTIKGEWAGEDEAGSVYVTETDDSDYDYTQQWCLYQEPKKPEYRYLFAKKNSVGTWITDGIFYTDLSASITLGPDAIKVIDTEIRIEE